MLALAKVLAVFALILILYRLRVPLAASIFLGAVALGAAFGQTPQTLVPTLLKGAVRPETIGLVLVTLLLLWLSELMDRAGQLKRIVDCSQRLLRRPVLAMAAMPALVGLLPMPGGALFSAPMVRHAVGHTPVAGGALSAINYWFRHVWEYWWPLYPGVILTMALTGVDPLRLMAMQFPLSVGMAVGGLAFLFRGIHPELHRPTAPAPAGTTGRLLRETSSIWIIIAVFLPAALVLHLGSIPGLPPAGRDVLRRYLPIALGLAASLLWTARLNRLSARHALAPLRQGKLYGMGLLVLAIMIFEHVLHQVEAAAAIRDGLAQADVPVLAAIVVLPFISGMVTGVAVGFVGTSFPLVIGLVRAMPGAPDLLPYIVLAYALGHMGQMLSPLHLCQVLSNQYFATGYGPVYRRIGLPAALTAVLAAGYFLLLLTASGRS